MNCLFIAVWHVLGSWYYLLFFMFDAFESLRYWLNAGDNSPPCDSFSFSLICADKLMKYIKWKDGLISAVLLEQILVIYLSCWLHSWQGKCWRWCNNKSPLLWGLPFRLTFCQEWMGVHQLSYCTWVIILILLQFLDFFNSHDF